MNRHVDVDQPVSTRREESPSHAGALPTGARGPAVHNSDTRVAADQPTPSDRASLREVARALPHLERELGAWQQALSSARHAAARLRDELGSLQAELATSIRPWTSPIRLRPADRGRPVATARRRIAVNFASILLTTIVLATIVGTAYSIETRQGHTSLPSHRLVGVTTDPWHSDDWSRALGGQIDIVANFMAWGYRKSPRERFGEARRRRLVPLITWEPWLPRATGAAQPRYSNATIARGSHDTYIRWFARESARVRGPVLLRFAHEMNGSWYPWHRNPQAYVAAWRRIHRIFREEGASNVIFVWAPNLPHGQYGFARWRRDVHAYWPGAAYVDWVGTTTIGRRGKSVPFYARRVELLRSYGKPIILAETFAVYGMREFWLPALRAWVRQSPWIRAVVWSESPHARSLRVDPRRQVFGRMIQDAKRR